jgi:phage baseplate assembly protein W
MQSLGFPKMFNSTSTIVIKNKEATFRNLKYLLLSEKGEFFGDPFFGIRIKRYTFEQNTTTLQDVLIDEIYTQISVFMPQIKVNRKDITIIQDKSTLYAKIKCINRVDFTTDLFNIPIFQEREQ